MRIEQLQQIAEIKKQRSISKAARALYMAQPSLSATLSSFEQEIGVQLFDRGAGGVTPTKDGEEILGMIEHILGYVDQIMHFKEGKQALSGEASLLITQAYQFLMVDILVEFKKRYPNATLNFRTLLPAQLMDEIARGAADIGLTLLGRDGTQDVELLHKRNIAYETFGFHQIMLYTHPAHPLANRAFVDMKELADVQLVVHAPHYWEAINAQVPLSKPPIIIDDSESLKRLVSEGYAVAVMPESVARQDLFLEHDLLAQIPMMGKGIWNVKKQYMLYPKKKKLAPLEEGVMQIIRDVLTQNNQ